MLLFRECDHLCGEIERLHRESACQKQIGKAPAAAATDVDREARTAEEAEGSLVLGDAIRSGKDVVGPVMGDAVVGGGGFAGFHHVIHFAAGSRGPFHPQSGPRQFQ